MSEFPSEVLDAAGNIHYLQPKPLGQGGQGVVLRTRSPHIAVKLIGAMPINASNQVPDPIRQEALRRRIEDVRTLPLSSLNLAQPLSILRDHVGYTMRLLNGMVPMRSLIAEPGEKTVGAFYQQTGGVGRRLNLLANTANLLARLHAVPLVYADISPNNVFISETTDASEVWLIDLDNLDYQSPSAPSVYTPSFGAPEVVTGKSSVTTLSDCYSFAVLAFYVLAQVHPFIGDYVENGDWGDDDGVDREQLAFQGDVPWIEDPDDNSNWSENGIPRHLVLSPPMRDLFQRTFGAGRKDRTKRPSMAEWADVLRRSVDRIVSCPDCGSTFDIARANCPFCELSPSPSFIHMQVNRWDPELEDTDASAVSNRAVWHKMIDATPDSVIEIRRHVVEATLAESEDPPVMRIGVLRSGITVEPLAGHEIHVARDGRLVKVTGKTKLLMPKQGEEVYLHFGKLNQPHRMAVLRYYESQA
jgi:DNA-binding helix-hairpin-helix protein with protein kinase domain